MQPYSECPQVLRDFLSYHESIKGQSRRTVSEYHLDLRMFLRFLTLMRKELPYQTPLDGSTLNGSTRLFSIRCRLLRCLIFYLILQTTGKTVKARLMSGSRPLPARGSCQPLRHSISI